MSRIRIHSHLIQIYQSTKDQFVYLNSMLQQIFRNSKNNCLITHLDRNNHCGKNQDTLNPLDIRTNIGYTQKKEQAYIRSMFIYIYIIKKRTNPQDLLQECCISKRCDRRPALAYNQVREYPFQSSKL